MQHGCEKEALDECAARQLSPYHAESDSKLSDARTTTRMKDIDEEDNIYWEKLNNAKLDARSEIKLDQWAQYGFAKIDLNKALGPPLNNIDCIHCDDCSPAEFVERFEVPCKPVLIRGLMDRWGAMKKWRTGYFLERYGETRLKCGEDDDGFKVKLRLKHFLRYMATQQDDSPLYMFDADFGDAGKETRGLLDDYSVPDYFGEDLLHLVGEDRRPPYRWLLIGPARSGSSIHVDPLGTSAWNAVVSGRKRWALFPPGTPRALVKPEAWVRRGDHEAIDWFLFHYDPIRASLPPHQQPMELIQEAGDVIMVPGGWWHTVLNLDDSVAVTQNFCSSTNFPFVWRETVRGRTRLAGRWLRTLRETRTDLYAVAQRLAGDGTGDVTAEEDIDDVLRRRRERKRERKARKLRRKEERSTAAAAAGKR